MDDVVAVRFRDTLRGEACVFTWGRIFDAVDPTELLAALKRVLPKAGYSDVAELRVCASLREARGFEYFYEALIHWAAEVAAHPRRDEQWRAKRRDDESLRKSIYILGAQIESDDCERAGGSAP